MMYDYCSLGSAECSRAGLVSVPILGFFAEERVDGERTIAEVLSAVNAVSSWVLVCCTAMRAWV